MSIFPQSSRIILLEKLEFFLFCPQQIFKVQVKLAPAFNRHNCSALTPLSAVCVGVWLCSPWPSPAEDTAPGARAAAATSTPQTGSAGRRATCTTWPASPASPARGSCPPGRSSLWWRRRCSAGFTTTACWTTSSGLWRKVSRQAEGTRFLLQKKQGKIVFTLSFKKAGA